MPKSRNKRKKHKTKRKTKTVITFESLGCIESIRPVNIESKIAHIKEQMNKASWK